MCRWRLGDGNEKWLLYEDAAAYVRTLGLTSQSAWREWCAIEENRPGDIPANPDIAYDEDGWISWPHFLGYDRE